MDTIEKILEIYKENNIHEGGFLHKKLVNDRIRSLNLDINEVRNSWHGIIGYGLLEQRGEDLYLTQKGESLVYK